MRGVAVCLFCKGFYDQENKKRKRKRKRKGVDRFGVLCVEAASDEHIFYFFFGVVFGSERPRCGFGLEAGIN